ncbi:MAG: flavin monoamine oxidase family protein [Proteobacteria bacterium]|nr:flavin monoamine oxidase family protein [Pseudomonadota bacterium]
MSKSRRLRRADVVVIGAGLAGLRAADILSRAGRSVYVVEARDRVGGRTLTESVRGAEVDLGAQWLGPTQHRARTLADELGVGLFPTPSIGKTSMELAGRSGTFKGTIPALPWLSLLDLQQSLFRLERRIAKVPTRAPWTDADAAMLDSMTVETLKQAYAHTDGVRAALDVMVRVVFGAEPSEVSALFFMHYLATGGGLQQEVEVEGGAQQDRLAGGAQQLAKGLAARLGDRVILDAAVESVQWSEEGVRLKTAAGPFAADRLVVALAPALAGRIRWSPKLPPDRDHLHMRMPMGSTTKCFAFYDRPFWRARGLSGEAMTDEGPLSYVCDNTQGDGSAPALLGFMVGGPSRRWQRRPAGERRGAVLAQLARFFGDEALSPVHYQEKRWDDEGFTGGCPIGLMGPGVLTQLGPALTRPVGPIHWAGTETASEWAGHMEGALESAERVVQEVLSP